jgi:tRNA threonylcarbamoyl adenosine modification protein YeaZ
MDTSAAQGSIALLDGDHLLAHHTFQDSAGHAVLLPQRCRQLLDAAGWQPKAVQLLAICNGPGAFAGLRIAFAFAQGFSLAHQIPIVGLSTLDLLAAQCPPESDWISVLVDARRNEIFAALYQQVNQQPLLRYAPGSALAPHKWLDALQHWDWPDGARLTVTGNALHAYPALTHHDAWPLPCQSSDPLLWPVDPVRLGQLAQHKWQQLPEPKALLTTLLDYQRRPDAEPPAALKRSS